MTLACESLHALAVLPHAAFHEPAPALGRKTDIAAGDLDAGGHPLDVPLPRPGQRLVEVVRTEDKPAVRSSEPSEVRDVSIAAGLHHDARIRSRRQIRRHHRCRPAVERERRDEHPPVADRDECLHARGRLGREHRDGIEPIRRRRPVAVSRPRRAPAGRSPTLRGLPRLQPRQSHSAHVEAGRSVAEAALITESMAWRIESGSGTSHTLKRSREPATRFAPPRRARQLDSPPPGVASTPTDGRHR